MTVLNVGKRDHVPVKRRRDCHAVNSTEKTATRGNTLEGDTRSHDHQFGSLGSKPRKSMVMTVRTARLAHKAPAVDLEGRMRRTIEVLAVTQRVLLLRTLDQACAGAARATVAWPPAARIVMWRLAGLRVRA